jgi:hypothetical protein
MKQSEFTYTIELSPKIRDGVSHEIGIRAGPSLNNVESFAAVLYFKQRDGTLVEIAKIDDSPHAEGEIHIDRYYREIGAEVKDFELNPEEWHEAMDYLKDEWIRFAQLYHKHHGNKMRVDGANE